MLVRVVALMCCLGMASAAGIQLFRSSDLHTQREIVREAMGMILSSFDLAEVIADAPNAMEINLVLGGTSFSLTGTYSTGYIQVSGPAGLIVNAAEQLSVITGGEPMVTKSVPSSQGGRFPRAAARLTARYAGFCVHCDQSFGVGTPIVRSATRNGWSHTSCVDECGFPEGPSSAAKQPCSEPTSDASSSEPPVSQSQFAQLLDAMRALTVGVQSLHRAQPSSSVHRRRARHDQ